MHSDPIADLLTRIRNGVHARKMSVECPHSKMKVELVKILEAEGFLAGHEITTESQFPSIKIHLKYDSKRKPVISHLKRISRPGLRIYRAKDELRPIRSGLATRVLTTSQGLMTDREARKRAIGGEVVCEVW